MISSFGTVHSLDWFLVYPPSKPLHILVFVTGSRVFGWDNVKSKLIYNQL